MNADVRHAESFKGLIAALKLAVAALREARVPFLLGGSFGAWARGGPEPLNDLDIMVKPQDADAALRALAAAGMRPERPPEGWLYKAWLDDVMIDIIFQPSGLEMTDEVFERAEEISVVALATPVMALGDVLVTMLMALDEHALDYSRVVAIARSLREQIDWPQLRARTVRSPYAKAFFTVVEELSVAPRHPDAQPGPSSRVRVLPGAS